MSNDIQTFTIAGRAVGATRPCYVIAEAGVNHNGSLDLALQLVDLAAEAGVDAIKFQTFRADNIVTRDAPKANYQIRNSGAKESQYDMLRKLELDASAHAAIAERCRRRGLTFLSTPFDEESADLLETVGVPAFKIPSGELTNLRFLSHVARKRLPMIISTGMATLDEVRHAVDTVRSAGCENFALLHCVSSYPAAPEEVNLRAMNTLARSFRAPVGYSDHTLGCEVACAAVALGACVIEKHMTVDRTLPGPDHQASATADEIASLVRSIRMIEAALGNGEKRPTHSEAETAQMARRSLVSACTIAAGSVLVAGMVTFKRPGTGMRPDQLNEVLGRVASCDIPVGTMLTREMLK